MVSFLALLKAFRAALETPFEEGQKKDIDILNDLFD